MHDETVEQILRDASFEENGRRKLACVKAFQLASANSIALLDIARICDDEAIQICKCQLGCFK